MHSILSVVPVRSIFAVSVKAAQVKDASAKLRIRLSMKRWVHFSGFASMDAVATFLNLPPAQGAGEAVVVPAAGHSSYDVLAYL